MRFVIQAQLQLLFTVFSVLGCSVPAGRADPPGGAESKVAECCSDPLLSRIVQETDLLILGEVHGTNEIPAYALCAIQAAVAEGGPVLLGLELPNDEQQAVDRYLRSAGDTGDRERLLRGIFWRLLAVDGRGSKAMLELIDAVRQLVAEGQSVGILCFDVVADNSITATRDQRMAKRILEHRTKHPRSRYVILVGASHAATVDRERAGGSSTTQMGVYLAQEFPDLIALRMRHAGGHAWCWPVGAQPGVHERGGAGAVDAYGVTLLEEPDGLGFTGVFDLGHITASPPANVDAGKPLFDTD